MNLREALIDARDRIADPARWCNKGHYALTVDGIAVAPSHPTAVAWCSIGSALVTSLNNGYEPDEMRDALRIAVRQLFPAVPSIVHLNDTLDHAAVMAIYDYAIEHAETQ